MRTAFINANIIDGQLDADGKISIRQGCVVINEDKIESVSYYDDIVHLPHCEMVDVRWGYLMPGLINLHTHLPLFGKPAKQKDKPTDYKKLYETLSKIPFALLIYRKMQEKNAADIAKSGVTTARTVGGILNHDTKIRNRIDKEKLIGPRLLVSNMAVSVPGGHFAGSIATEAATPSEASEQVEKIAKDNPDLIKIMITGGVMDASEDGTPGKLMMPAETVKAACDKAHELGYKVAAHVECSEGVRIALENGVDTIEHGADIDDYTINLYKEKNAAVVCTLSPAFPGAVLGDTVCPDFEILRRNSTIVLNGIINGARKCLDNGISVGLGTDSGCPYVTQYGTWRELDYWVKMLGVTPDFALHTATQINAEIAGISDITGTIEPGKSADIIISENNPLDNFRALEHLKAVYVKGKQIPDLKIKRLAKVDRALDEAVIPEKLLFKRNR